MATSLHRDDFVSCSICLLNMQNRHPRHLKCHHSFCEECIQKLVDQNPAKKHLVCPECREKTKLPAGGVAALPVDFKISSMAEALEKMSSGDSCYFCSKEGTHQKACSFCRTCKRYLCEKCTVQHKEIDLLKDHVIEEVEEKQTGQQCGIHNEAMTHYCRACTRGLCTVCVLSNQHSVHKEMVSDYKNGIEEEKVFLRDTCSLMQDQMKDLSNVQSSRDQVKQHIRQAAEAMKKRIDAQVKTLLAQVETNEKQSNQKVTVAVQQVVQDSTMALVGMDDKTFTLQLPRLKKDLQSALQMVLECRRDRSVPKFYPSTEKPNLGTIQTGSISEDVDEASDDEDEDDDSEEDGFSDEDGDEEVMGKVDMTTPGTVTMKDVERMVDALLKGEAGASETGQTESKRKNQKGKNRSRKPRQKKPPKAEDSSRMSRKKPPSESGESEDCVRCRKSGHEPGDPVCEASIPVPDSNIFCFARDSDPLSNFYLCQFFAFGVSFKSVEHAFQYNKAMDCGKESIANTILTTRHAHQVRGLVRSIGAPHDWDEKHEDLMKFIVRQKVEQVPEVRRALLETGNKMLAQAVRDRRWGTGLDKHHTEHTKVSYWPGKNLVGQMLMDIRQHDRHSKSAYERLAHQKQQKQITGKRMRGKSPARSVPSLLGDHPQSLMGLPHAPQFRGMQF